MNLFLHLHPYSKRQKDPADRHLYPLHDASEGSEFLDEAIYENDMPLASTEESTDLKSPQDPQG